MVSDNVAAETLSRHAAIAAGAVRQGFSGAASAVQAWMTAHGLWVSGQRIWTAVALRPPPSSPPPPWPARSNWPLSTPRSPRSSRASGGRGERHPSARFDGPSEKAGRHTVRAKTGTLSGLASLAGYLTTADGAVLVFAERRRRATTGSTTGSTARRPWSRGAGAAERLVLVSGGPDRPGWPWMV